MRLLDKQTIATQKSSERAKEVAEGVKLAKSIDSLRETHAKEQSKLKLFRDSTLRNIKEEIDVLLQRKNALQAEIAALEVKRKILLG